MLGGIISAAAASIEATRPPFNRAAPDAVAELKALQAIPVERVSAGTPRLSQEAVYERNQRLHTGVWQFLERFPDNPLRWDAMILLKYGTGYRVVIEQNGKSATVPDTVSERAWMGRYKALLQDLVAAPDASDNARREALSYLITQNVARLTRKLSPEPGADLAELTQYFHALKERYSRTVEYVNACRGYANVLNMLDPNACLKFLLELKEAHTSGQYPDSQLQDVVTTHLRMLRQQTTPLELDLVALDGRRIQSAGWRGKVVLIAISPLNLTANLDVLRNLHQKYHEQGLEIIQITFAFRLGEAPDKFADEIVAAEQAKQAQLPWPVAYDVSKYPLGSFAEKFGINFVPAWLVLGRDGCVTTSPFSMTYKELERALQFELGFAGSSTSPAIER